MLVGHFGLFINPASKARFPPPAVLRLPIALTLGLGRYLAPAELPMQFIIMQLRSSFRSGLPWGARYGWAIESLGDKSLGDKLAILQN